MNRVPKTELLRALQLQIQHFDESPDFGDSEAVAVIRQHLLLRIQEAEGALRAQTRVKLSTVIDVAIRSEAA